MGTLPEDGFLRLRQIIGDPKAEPPIPPLIPIGKSSWWEGVKSGRFPAPLKLSERVTVWKSSDIRELIAQLGRRQEARRVRPSEPKAAKTK